MRIRVVAAAAVLGGSILLAGCTPPGIVCSAVMYITPGPVVVEVDPAIVGDGSLSACLGRECEPVALAPTASGVWHVPATSLDGVDPGEGVRVFIRDVAGATIREEWKAVPYDVVDPGPCPGPITIRPVQLG